MAVDPEFRSMLGSVLHGTSLPGGVRKLAVDTGVDGRMLQAVEMHELVHEDLSDNSCFGNFQQIIASARNSTRGAKRAILDRVLTQSFRVCEATHEGAATVRELAYIAYSISVGAADDYVRSLPDKYVRAYSLYYPFFADPRDVKYFEFPAGVYHVSLISLAISAMNSAILRDFGDPVSILDGSGEIDLKPYSPDERMGQLLDHMKSAQHGFLEATMENLADFRAGAFSRSPVGFVSDSIDRMVAAMRSVLPELQWVNTEERGEQQHAFRHGWRAYLEGTRWALPPGPRVKALHDASREATLSATFERLNRQSHEAYILPASNVGWEEFIATHSQPHEGIIRLVFLSTDPLQVSDELMPFSSAMLMSVPLRTGILDSRSPVEPSGRVLMAKCPMADFVHDSADPWPSPTFFYSDSSRIQSLLRLYPNWHPWSIQKCPNANTLLALVPKLGNLKKYTKLQINDVEVLQVVSDRTVLFCFVMPLHVGIVEEELAKLGVNVSQGDNDFNVAFSATASVPVASIARAAYWAFVGR